MQIRSDRTSACLCHDANVMVIEKRTLSHVAAGGIIAVFFIFVAGYYLGKRVASQEFLETIEQDTFADRIAHSLHTMYVPQKRTDDQKLLSSNQLEADELPEALQSEMAPACQAAAPIALEQQTAADYYVAQLLGGNLETTQKFAAQLKARGIDTQLIKRESKTAKQNVVYWYQVVTERFAEKKKLESLVAQIKKISNLHDVKIIKI